MLSFLFSQFSLSGTKSLKILSIIIDNNGNDLTTLNYDDFFKANKFMGNLGTCMK
jgi:hypothetical protein